MTATATPVTMKAADIIDRDIVVVNGEQRTVDFAFVLPATRQMCVDFEGFDRDKDGKPEAFFTNYFDLDEDVEVIRAAA
jgi:hypothetical protein